MIVEMAQCDRCYQNKTCKVYRLKFHLCDRCYRHRTRWWKEREAGAPTFSQPPSRRGIG